MGNSLDRILKELDEKCELLSEEEISTKIIDECNSGEDDFKINSEVIAFDLGTYNEGSNWGTYYGPKRIILGEEYPRQTDIDSKKIDYWLSRVNVTQNPIMKSRYADLVWDFSEKIGKKKDFKMAQTVIDNNIVIVKERLYNDVVSALSKLERGLKIALILKDKTRIKIIKELILEFEGAIAEDHKPETLGFSFDLLLENKNIKLTEAERTKIITNLESEIIRLRSKKDPDPWAIEGAAIRLATYYNKLGQRDDVSRTLNILREEYKKYSITTSASPGQVQGWLDNLHGLFMRFQLNSEVEEIRKEIRENNIKVYEGLHKFSQSFEIPSDAIDNYVESFLSHNVNLDLTKLSIRFVPKIEEVQEQINNSSNIAPLSYLIPKTIIDEHGRRVEIGSLKDNLNGHIIQQVSFNLQIRLFVLDKVIKKIIEHHKLDDKKLLEILMESPVFLEERYEILKKSIQMYFNEDYISFCHIVLPQIEFAIRTLLSLCGGSIYKPSKFHKGYEFKVLGDLLRDPIIEDVYNSDYQKYFQVVLIDKEGLNLRNDICHGVSNSKVFNQNTANILFHLLITLSLFQEEITTI